MTPFDYFQVRAEKGKGHDPVEKLRLICFWTTNLGKSDYMALSLDWRCIADREATQGVSQLKGKIDECARRVHDPAHLRPCRLHALRMAG